VSLGRTRQLVNGPRCLHDKIGYSEFCSHRDCTRRHIADEQLIHSDSVWEFHWLGNLIAHSRFLSRSCVSSPDGLRSSKGRT
jgi:hypothetical protein